MVYFNQLMDNRLVGAAVLAWAIAQVIKIVMDIIEHKSLDWSLFISSGGMPSSHTSFVTALAFSTGFKQGYNSVEFAIAFVLAMVVMYDAQGVRRAAGKQAAVLNLLLERFETHGFKVDVKLKELLGHTPIEVGAGAILGFAVACLYYL